MYPQSRQDALERNKHAQAELDAELAKLTLDQQRSVQGLTQMTLALPIPHKVEELEEEPFTELAKILSEKSSEELCALFEEKEASGLLLVMVAKELRKRLQERKMTPEQENLLAMSYLHLSSEGMERRFPASVAEIPLGLGDMISDHNKLLAALDQLKHGGRPTIIDKARQDITTIFEREQEKEMTQLHIRALKVYFEMRFGGLVEKSDIPRAQEMLFTFAKVEQQEMRDFLQNIVERHPTEEIRMAAVHALVYLNRPEDRIKLAKRLKPDAHEKSPYVASTIMSVLHYCVREYHVSRDEKKEIRACMEAYKGGHRHVSASLAQASSKLMASLEAA